MPRQIRVARDLPLMAQVRDLVRFARTYHQEPVIERQLVYAKTAQDYAIGVIAYKRYYGRMVDELTTQVAQDGYKLAMTIITDLNAKGEFSEGENYTPNRDIIPANMYSVVTPAVPCWNGEGSAYGVGLSDEARKTRAQEQRGSGISHRSRVTRKNQTCKPFGQLLPTHWRTGR